MRFVWYVYIHLGHICTNMNHSLNNKSEPLLDSVSVEHVTNLLLYFQRGIIKRFVSTI